MSEAEKTFVEKCLSGDALAEDVDDYVHRWHLGEGDPEASLLPTSLDLRIWSIGCGPRSLIFCLSSLMPDEMVFPSPLMMTIINPIALQREDFQPRMWKNLPNGSSQLADILKLSPEEKSARLVLSRFGERPPVNVRRIASEYASIKELDFPISCDAVTIREPGDRVRPRILLNTNSTKFEPRETLHNLPRDRPSKDSLALWHNRLSHRRGGSYNFG